ncbi:uncharacterized protein LOC135702071 [Ochlerotatus camptorhynchus]|uniref:uncharacterized protein LOC135702071 n=1 Tax=Ochlerotatus camptorhynchus TaxID=644619 RepID=UPI0031DB61E2
MDKHFIHTHWSLFLIFSSVGLLPLSLDKHSFHVKESIGKILYWVAIFIVINSICFYQFRYHSLTGNWNGLVVKFSEWCVLILIVTDLSCTLIQALLSRHTHKLLLNDMDITDFIIYNKYTIQRTDRKVKHYTMLKLLFLEGIWLILSILKFLNLKDQMVMIQETLMSIPICWLTNVRLVMQTFYIDLITERLTTINGELELFGNINIDPKFTKIDQHNYREAVVKVQDTYTRIWKCFMIINGIFGWSTVLLVMKQFVLLIATSFWCINRQKSINDDGSTYLESCTVIIYIVSSLSFLCHSAATCKKEASKTAEALLKPEYNYEDLDIRDFLAQMQHQPFITTANGFFDIDYGLLGSTLATTVTYIVIMLQLEEN